MDTPLAGYLLDTPPISDAALQRLQEKAWGRVGPPSQTFTLRLVTLRQLIARLRVLEAEHLG